MLVRVHGFAHPGKVHVQAADRHDMPFSVLDGIGIRGQAPGGIDIIEIRIRPVGLAAFHHLPVKRILRIVVVPSGNLLHVDGLSILIGIRFIQTPLYGRIRGDETDASSHHMRVVIDEVHHRPEDGIRVVQAEFQIQLVLAHGAFRQVQHVADPLLHRQHGHMGPRVHLLFHDGMDTTELYNGNTLHQNGGDDHDTQAGQPTFL